MPEHISNIIIVCLFAGIGLLALVGILLKLIKNRRAAVVTVNAVVIDKHKTEVFSKYSGNGRQVKYTVIFLAEGKKLSFHVSEFSYAGYQVNEKGTLKYKGNRLIEFR